MRTAPKLSPTCAWCGKPIAVSSQGRRRKYCSAACKQRAYEQRAKLTAAGIPQDCVILSSASAARLKDTVFQLRCAAEDISTAAAEGATSEELQVLCQELLDIARQVEKMR